MSPRSAPRAATWLLERLGTSGRFEPLIGDLTEQFAQGRSRLWYWRQALGATAIHLVGILRAHGPSFLAALVVGCILNALLEHCCSLTFQPVYQNLAAVKLRPWSTDALLHLAGMMANTLSWCAICITSVWVVTRVHRSNPRAVLLAFVAALLAQRVPGIAVLIVNAGADRNGAIALATQVILAGLDAAFMLVAGLLVVRAGGYARIGRATRVVAVVWLAQVFVTSLLFAARRVGELSYSQPEGYLSMYALAALGGFYLTVLLWSIPTRSAISAQSAR
jgi:hypothetical protein